MIVAGLGSTLRQCEVDIDTSVLSSGENDNQLAYAGNSIFPDVSPVFALNNVTHGRVGGHEVWWGCSLG